MKDLRQKETTHYSSIAILIEGGFDKQDRSAKYIESGIP